MPWRRLALIFATYALLAVWYSFAHPLWEQADEQAHVEMVRYLQVHRALPTEPPPGPPVTPPRGYEYMQPPLYYLLVGAAASGIYAPPEAEVHRNPRYTWVGTEYEHAVSLRRLDELPPYGGLARIAYVGRLIAAALGLVVIAATYALVRAVTGRDADALFAAAWLAWSAGFILAHARVNNDSASAAASAVTLALCVRAIAAAGELPRPGLLGALSVALTAALMSKLHTAFLVPLVGLAAAAGRGALPQRALRAGGVLASPLVLTLAWYTAYAAPLAAQLPDAGLRVARVWEVLPNADWSRLPAGLWWLHQTWVGTVGLNVRFRWPDPLYAALAVPVVAALGVGLVAAVRAPTRTPALLCLAATPLLYATFARYVAPSVGQGWEPFARFVMPTAPIVALVVAMGWRALPLGSARATATALYLGTLLATAVALPVLLVPRVAVATIPARLPRGEAERVGPPLAAYANGVELLAVEGLPDEIAPNAVVAPRLLWRVPTAPIEDFTASLHVVGPSGETLVSDDRVPHEALLPPREWLSGEIVEEPRELRVPAEPPPGAYTLRVGLYRWVGSAREPVPRVDTPNDLSIGEWRLLPPPGPPLARRLDVRFGEGLLLRGATASRGAAWRVSLEWEAIAPTSRRIVISAQLLDSAGRLVAQHDAEPVENRLPTSSWRVGDVVRDERTVVPPPGEAGPLRLHLIAYDRETLARLPVTAPGVPPSDSLLLEG